MGHKRIELACTCECSPMFTVYIFTHKKSCNTFFRWFEEAGDAKGGWDIEKITNKIGEADCHVVNENNVMELNLVDIVGKSGAQNTGVSSDSSPAASDSKNKD